VYPNPMKDFININININSNLNSNISVKIFDLDGKVIKNLYDNNFIFNNLELKWDGTNEANKQVAKGIYLLIVSSNGLTKYSKIVIE
ncbi:MAG TPA: T9SS type A sorting domain-containing protein, partial [Candidatus Kapabacteria bacterium]|nr:T9SS type A sorting domain-containing protein [Candidatus Kapabacteria bacterium]